MMLLSEERVRELAARETRGIGLERAVAVARTALREGAAVARRMAALGTCPIHGRPWSADCAQVGCPGALSALTWARREIAALRDLMQHLREAPQD